CAAACNPNPCQNNGTCTPAINGYTCECEAGFAGKDCAFPVRFCDGSFSINDEADLDAVEGCTTITGTLTINAFDGFQATRLGALTRVAGSLTVANIHSSTGVTPS